jgi:hypothetical protein
MSGAEKENVAEYACNFTGDGVYVTGEEKFRI